ncbi:MULTISPECIES: DUF418 domain-containing protein [Pseudonocardia]|uniref:DUF418 domain-containing protein n=2 Tax=Pseudonocardia TaxID=1847 RepID=A0A1Y2MI68_PSEAH|nr:MULTISPECIES: DUF418 domain-containing protein [Pseudonocardia]OSY34964.1 hypothetical protein BG845_06420 [Pseudonocardia autotrophica]TDN72558.1 putative membrane protein YeiB [Pseudonocardia autotrophica]BBG03266.1 hypothetical protein Pdca_44750 [Pseudonocardia autotrophica]GEC24524.1 hypothetical protein PSA01_15530 [Pseudonocardia saturnea]
MSTTTGRIRALDAIRGLALAGILIVNIPPLADMPIPARDGWEGGTEQWFQLLVQQRFFPIFSFLFGLGFAIFLQRAATRTDRPRLVLLRRLLALGVLGALHQLLHPGEALLPYAIAGIVVLLPASWLPRIVVLLGGIAATGIAVFVLHGGILLIPGMFLLGAAAARYGIPERLERPGVGVGVVCAVAVAGAVPLLVLQTGSIRYSGFDHLSPVAGLVLAVAYVTGLALLLRTPAGPALSAVLEPLGRMALTNYLGATLLVLAFAPLIGLSGSERYPLVLVLAAAILAVQVPASRWWLRRFAYGPVEWLWRMVSWWAPVPLRRSAD